jgi:hypothetical protein
MIVPISAGTATRLEKAAWASTAGSRLIRTTQTFPRTTLSNEGRGFPR